MTCIAVSRSLAVETVNVMFMGNVDARPSSSMMLDTEVDAKKWLQHPQQSNNGSCSSSMGTEACVKAYWHRRRMRQQKSYTSPLLCPPTTVHRKG